MWLMLVGIWKISIRVPSGLIKIIRAYRPSSFHHGRVTIKRPAEAESFVSADGCFDN